MKKRILKKWVKHWLSIENVILFSFVAMVNDFTFLGFFIILGILLKLFINISILNKNKTLSKRGDKKC